MIEAAVHGAIRIAGSASAVAATLLGAGAAWAHPGHPAGEHLLGEPLHVAFGMHWAVVEPLLLLGALAALSRLAAWAADRWVARRGQRRRVLLG